MRFQSVYEFFNDIYRDNDYRLYNRRNLMEDLKQYDINMSLRSDEEILISKYYSNEIPIVFVVGSPRSGTTLLTQVLAANYNISYFPNVIAPYYMAPIRGLQLTKKLDILNGEINFDSTLGITKEKWEPHEIGYFWQYWFNHQGTDELNDKDINAIDWKGLERQLNAVASFFGQPLIIKSLPFINYKILKLDSVFNNVYFIYIKRNPKSIVQSVLGAREKIYGDINKWWSIRPNNIEELINKSAVEQVFAQYRSVTSAIENAFKKLDVTRKITINYEQLIDSPEKTTSELFSFIKTKSKAFKYENKSTDKQLSSQRILNQIEEYLSKNSKSK